MKRFVRVYLLPGAVMQSVMIGGAYGTGREMTQYFTQFGMLGGALGLCVSAVCIAVVFALSLEISRRFQVFDYRQFSRILLGRGWFVFEMLAITLLLIVIAVITAASGSILADEFGASNLAGGAVTLAVVAVLIYCGRSWVTTMLASWSLLLYLVFLSYLVIVFTALDPTESARQMTIGDGWFTSGLQYGMYNIAAIPIILYASRAIETGRQAALAACAGALIAVVPAFMLHLSFAVDYPAVVSAELPVYHVLGLLELPVLKLVYLLVIFGTFIETAAGSIQGVIERIEGTISERRGASLKRSQHAMIAVGMMLAAVLLSTFGLIALVAKGYGAIAWGFMLFYALPLLTVGVYKLYVSPART